MKRENIKKTKKAKRQQSILESTAESNSFNFGGIPKNVPFKRNMGCGG